ncbi:unnamed protein product [Prorocentrum cordatum]|uniref:Uncharacterized protein n=1 Tax=Prorocentrum cordatum TaxID=2364126 RepID=A0ABN9UQ82_9DINO|nr:unnamed protein product [Polarella glacialis]
MWMLVKPPWPLRGHLWSILDGTASGTAKQIKDPRRECHAPVKSYVQDVHASRSGPTTEAQIGAARRPASRLARGSAEKPAPAGARRWGRSSTSSGPAPRAGCLPRAGGPRPHRRASELRLPLPEHATGGDYSRLAGRPLAECPPRVEVTTHKSRGLGQVRWGCGLGAIRVIIGPVPILLCNIRNYTDTQGPDTHQPVQARRCFQPFFCADVQRRIRSLRAKEQPIVDSRLALMARPPLTTAGGSGVVHIGRVDPCSVGAHFRSNTQTQQAARRIGARVRALSHYTSGDA